MQAEKFASEEIYDSDEYSDDGPVEEVQIGVGPIYFSQPDWYASAFETLTLWSQSDFELLFAHLRGQSPYMSSFDIYRTSLELIRLENVGAVEEMKRLEADVDWLQAKKSIRRINHLITVFGSELLEALTTFLQRGNLDLGALERDLKNRFDHHVSTRIFAVKSLLLGTGEATELVNEDGQVSLVRQEGEQLSGRKNHSLLLDVKILPTVENIEVIQESNDAYRKSSALLSRIFVAMHPFHIKSGLKSWSAKYEDFTVSGTYTPPSTSKSVGRTEINIDKHYITVPGTTSQLFVAEDKRTLIVRSSQAVGLFVGAKSIFQISLNALPEGCSIDWQKGGIFHEESETATFISRDGRLVHISEIGVAIEAIQLAPKLCKKIIETANSTYVESNTHSALSVATAHDELNQRNLKPILRGLVETENEIYKYKSARGLLGLSQTELDALAPDRRKSLAIQKRIVSEVCEAYKDVPWGHSKVLAEFAKLKELGWPISILKADKKSAFNVKLDCPSGTKRYTRIEHFGKALNSAIYFWLPAGLKLFVNVSDSRATLLVPEMPPILEVEPKKNSFLPLRRDAPSDVNFDEYEYSKAELELLSSYASQLL